MFILMCMDEPLNLWPQWLNCKEAIQCGKNVEECHFWGTRSQRFQPVSLVSCISVGVGRWLPLGNCRSAASSSTISTGFIKDIVS